MRSRMRSRTTGGQRGGFAHRKEANNLSGGLARWAYGRLWDPQGECSLTTSAPLASVPPGVCALYLLQASRRRES
eukprot:7019594-Pyramimonas_sp.AAC.1